MAAKQTVSLDRDPILSLTEEAAEALRKMDGDLEASHEYINGLEELGFDVSRQRAQLDQAVKLRDLALKLFKK